MLVSMELLDGVTLRCCRDDRFKHGALSIQFVRPMCAEEAAYNALLPAVLLRGTQQYPDLRAITWRLDDLYGAAVGALVRRVGDYQTTGLYCSFIEDRFAMAGDQVLQPMAEFTSQLLFEPLLEDGGFVADFVQSEKKNLISTIESEINDKRVYASAQLMKLMCKGDSFGLPRLGTVEQVQKIDPKMLYHHYRRILRESPVELFYVGGAQPEQVAQLLRTQFEKLERNVCPLPEQTAFTGAQGTHQYEQMDVTQAKLCMGFVTPVTNQSDEFAAMQVMNTVYGAGMTSKLFLNLREKQSLCYSISSGYYGSKGIMTVGAGIDACNEEIARSEILKQLQLCCEGDITPAELEGAKEAILSGLQTIHDSPGAIEGYYATGALSGLCLTPQEYAQKVKAVTVSDVAAAARKLQYHSSFCLKGERA